MFKKTYKLMVGALAGVLVFSAVAQSAQALGMDAAVPAARLTALSPEEMAGLLYMLEEEKLARDVYNELYALWGASVFQNIAASEQTHMNAIQTLVVRYGLTDPALPAGKYANPDLQALHDELVRRGGQSLAEALKVGANIEEIDIMDLQTRLAQTDAADIQAVYNNLLRGSYNHLRAFSGAGGRPSWAGGVRVGGHQ